jgi:hypothetical protein
MLVSQRLFGILPGIKPKTQYQSQSRKQESVGLSMMFLLLFLVGIYPQSSSAAIYKSWETVTGSQIAVKLDSPIHGHGNDDATVNVNLSNVSGQTLAGPFRLIITDLMRVKKDKDKKDDKGKKDKKDKDKKEKEDDHHHEDHDHDEDDKISISNATGITDAGEPYFDLTGYIGASFPPAGTGIVNILVKESGKKSFSFNVRIEQQITHTLPLILKITSPATLFTVGSTPQTVKGTVSDPAAQLTLNGAPVTNSNGSFQADVTLDEGHNTITARAIDAEGQDVTDAISLSLDMTPPYLTVESPKDGDTVRTGKIAVSGLINDIVRGTVAEGQAHVTVNGKAASISNRSYLAEDIVLSEGDNILKIDGADNVGNTSSISIKVKYQPLAPQHIEVLSGQGQTAKINTTLAQPFKVNLLDDKNQPIANKPVIFRVTEGDGVVGADTQDQGQGVLVQTDTEGVAATSFKLGSRVGVGNQRVRATAVGFDGEALFYATATGGIGNKVTVNSGNNQRGAISQPLPQPFVVAVVDEGANVVPGAQIEFKVTQGSGKFQNGQTNLISQTDSDGRATAELTLGAEEGLDVQRATATLVGTPLYAGFTASALKTGDPGQTSISGVVLDNQDQPLPGVTVRVDGTTREAQTDAQGQFKITEAPTGSVRLIADGSTTTAAGEWPTLAFNLVTIAGADNPLPVPVYLVKLDTVNAKQVGDQDVTLTLPDVPGFALEVKAGSVTFPDGKKTGKLSVTPVNASKIPMSPPNGMQPQFIATIQPVGAKFDPPARLSLPNVDGHKPGAQVEMYSYDHDLEEFVSIGLGTVNTDGSIIKSNQGVGVIKAGWHCGSQPGGSGCCGSPGDCKALDGSCQVVNDNSKTPADTKGDCKKPECQSGSPSQVPDNSDTPSDSIKGDCKKPGCNGGLLDPAVPDDSDGPSLKDVPCAKCEKGSLTISPIGTSCDDGLFCTSYDGMNPGSDQCLDGVCKGKQIPRKKTSEQVFEFDGGRYLRFIDDPLSVVFATLKAESVSRLDDPTSKGQRKEIKTEECCETDKKILPGTAVEENITLERKYKYDTPPRIFLTPAGNINLIGKGSVAGQAKVYHVEYSRTCSDPDQCNSQGGAQVGINATAGLELSYLHPNIISAEGQLKGGGTGDFSEKCGVWQGKGCFGPVEAKGTVKGLSFISYSWSTIFEDSFICTDGGTVNLN